jgi:hypothetical protein
MERNNAMKAIAPTLLALTVATLAAGGAHADVTVVFTGQVIGPVAELTPQERAWFHQRWQELPPDEREMLRRKLRQDLPDTPPEVRQKRREELMERMDGKREIRRQRERDQYEVEQGYGQGYGTRPWPAPVGNDDRNRGRR